jgi:hypothetical protein
MDMMLSLKTLLLLLILTSSVLAAPILKVDVYHAQHENIRNDVNESHPLRPSFDELFAYPRYERIATASIDLSQPYDRWLVPNKNFSIRIEEHKKNHLWMDFFRDKRLIFRSRINPSSQQPVVITGPYYQQGRLIFTVQQIP